MPALFLGKKSPITHRITWQTYIGGLTQACGVLFGCSVELRKLHRHRNFSFTVVSLKKKQKKPALFKKNLTLRDGVP